VVARLLALLALALFLGVALGFWGSLHPALDSLGVIRPAVGAAALALVPLAALARARLAARIALGAVLLAAAGTVPYALDLSVTARARDGQAPGLRVVSFNLFFGNDRPEAVTAWLRASDADVILLQEAGDRNRPILAALRDLYPAQVWCEFSGGGVAVLSRLPEVARGRDCMFAPGLSWLRVRSPAGEVTFASLHLRWPWPWPQAQQIARLEPRLAALPGPLILAGDFNAMPWSAALSRLARAARAERVPGLLWTRLMPGTPFALPIDHVLADPALAPLAAGLGPELGSDHRPVIVEFAWR
jgi:endonuclease/exonuclease/phosphatase (EEP) superfamily protein YafD